VSERVSHTRICFERWTTRRSKEIEQSNNINPGHCRSERARLLAVAASPCGPRRVIPGGWASGCSHKAASWNELGTHPCPLPLVHVRFGHELSRLRRGLSLDEMRSGPGPFHRGVCNFNKPYYEVVSTKTYGNYLRLGKPVTQTANPSLCDPCKSLNTRRKTRNIFIYIDASNLIVIEI